MRKKLKQIGKEERHTFTGTFVKFGFKNGYMGPVETLLLVDVKDNKGNIVTDHLWFNKTKGFAKLELEEGDIVKFDARVSEYEKGYKGYNYMQRILNPVSKDYRLTYPTKIELVSKGDGDAI